MMKHFKLGFLPILTSLLLFPAVSFSYTDGIAIKVNAEIFTFSEVEDKLSTELKRSGIPDTDEEKVKETRTNLVSKMVEGVLIKDRAIDKEIEVSNTEVEKAIDNIKQKNGISDEIFTAMLSNQGVTLEEYQEQIREQILSSRVLNEEVNAKILIEDAAIKKYYAEHKEEFQTEREIEVEHILLILKSGATSYQENEVVKKITDLREEIMKGASFEKMAALHSQDPSKGETGSIGYIKRGTTVPPFENAAFSLKIGELSEPVRTSFGYHLIKVINEKPRAQLSFEEAAPLVKDRLFKEAFDKRFAEWMSGLKKDAFIEYSDGLAKMINPIGDQKVFEAVGAYKYPISRKERERIGKKHYLSVEEKRELASKANSEKQDIDLKPEMLEKVKFYKSLFDKGLISKKEYLEKLNSLNLN